MVQAGTLFGYLAAFITIVLGLALADLLASLHRLLRARRRVVWRPLPLLLALFVLSVLLTGFFQLWEITGWEGISYYGLVWEVGNYIPIFLAASAVLPDEVPPGRFDLDDFYFEERRYIVALLALSLVLDTLMRIAMDWQPIVAGLPEFWIYSAPLTLIALAAFATIAWSRRKWAHWLAFALLFGAAHVGFSVWEIEGAPAWSGAPPSR